MKVAELVERLSGIKGASKAQLYRLLPAINARVEDGVAYHPDHR